MTIRRRGHDAEGQSTAEPQATRAMVGMGDHVKPRSPFLTILFLFGLVALQVAVVIGKGFRSPFPPASPGPQRSNTQSGKPTMEERAQVFQGFDANSTIMIDGLPVRVLSEDPIFQEILRRLADTPSGYAWGASSIFWMNGKQQEDYPYLCQCDQTQLAQFKSGTLPTNKPSYWDKLKPKPVYGPSCSGTFSDAIISMGSPKCDAANGDVRVAAPSFVLISAIIFSVIMYVF